MSQRPTVLLATCWPKAQTGVSWGICKSLENLLC